jgi:hypothetical protein
MYRLNHTRKSENPPLNYERRRKKIIEKKQTEAQTPHQHVAKAVTTIAICALATFCLGSIQSPWPAAVASCGLSVMGVGVAYVMLRRP